MQNRKKSIYDEIPSLSLLLFLYILQGVPMGISASLPYILQNRISYSHQGLLTLVSMPFSLKLLWAPIVDTYYFKSIGKRKSWLILAQLASGSLMLWGGVSGNINHWIGEDLDRSNIFAIFIFFVILYFLIATQDIAVDGWSLTMLSPQYVSYGASCNTAGQVIGYNLTFIGFLVFNDPSSCNKYFRRVPSDVGLVSISSLFRFWGWVIVISTILIGIFKTESTETESKLEERDTAMESPIDKAFSNKKLHIVQVTDTTLVNDSQICPIGLTLRDAYSVLWKLVNLKAVQNLIIVLLTCRIAFAATDATVQLKVVQYGFPKAEMAVLIPLLVPIGVISNVLASKLSFNYKALKVFSWGIPIRLVMSAVCCLLVAITSIVYTETTPDFRAPYWYYLLLLCVMALYGFCTDLMYISMMMHFTEISDPLIGGTYMTFLNTVSNFGAKWPHGIALYLIDFTTFQDCPYIPTAALGNVKCLTYFDGFYVVSIFCILFGFFWIWYFQKFLKAIENASTDDWRIPLNSAELKAE